MSSPKVAILTPCHDAKLLVRYIQSLHRTFHDLSNAGVRVSWQTICFDSLVCRARDNLAQLFLDSDATHALFIDSDISWNGGEDVLRLLGHGLDVVAGAYRIKAETTRWACDEIRDQAGVLDVDPRTSCVKCFWVGTGFVLIARTVFEQLATAYPEARIENAEQCKAEGMVARHNYFQVGVGNGVFYSEGLGFCWHWRGICGQVWVDPTVRLVHHGAYAYEGDPMTLFEAG